MSATLTRCPEWCTLAAGHDWDTDLPGGSMTRGHGGPTFGKFVYVSAVEFSDHPGELLHIASLAVADEDLGSQDLDRDDLTNLAVGAIEAAAWLRDVAGVSA